MDQKLSLETPPAALSSNEWVCVTLHCGRDVVRADCTGVHEEKFPKGKKKYTQVVGDAAHAILCSVEFGPKFHAAALQPIDIITLNALKGKLSLKGFQGECIEDTDLGRAAVRTTELIEAALLS